MTIRKKIAFVLALVVLALSISQAEPKKGLEKIDHIVVIYLENRSFDNLFGLFPGANGLAKAKKAPLQIDEYGRAYIALPPVFDGKQRDNRFPGDLPNQPFDIAKFVKPDQKHPDLTHRFYINQMQINGGRNDRFAQLSSAGGLTMGYYDLSGSALWNYAKEFTLADNFFQSAFGGSFLNHQWLICACTPEFKAAPVELRQWKNDPNTGKPVNDPIVTDDGYVVGTIQPYNAPYDESKTGVRLPVQYHTTIGDRLSEKGISWAWYSGGWDDAVAKRKTDDNFQYHHQPFVYYANYAPGSRGRAEHLKDKTNLLADLNGVFPQVAFFKPAGSQNQHPGYATLQDADAEVKEIVEAIRNSAIWSSTAIIITYDEYGGFWDHVAPPVIDRWGPGTRVPAIIVSPFAKKGYVDHTGYDTTSILKLIETRFDLEPLADRDAQANDLHNAFNFK
ncbi:MAG: acid phosphatase [Methylobacter sp.]|nr:acid phosphatase [Methylobacter sp.]MDP2100140.1 acid phosphatase [Methylobacter sp.]MDP2428434.1 acid phosphatase [Methylobacter sp.]MDP3054114.1 acid phosphatase [Methylobacter sp.]MDP3362811.1 acid phosphatase [Methylobacter sp.]